MLDLQGQLLIARPSLAEPALRRSVVLIVDHAADGSLGVVLNRPSKIIMTSLAGSLFDADFRWNKPLHLGGPVKSSLRVLHTDDQMADRRLIGNIHLTTEATKTQHILSRRIEPSIVIANHSVWSALELEDQIERGWWYRIAPTAESLFLQDERNYWRSLCRAAEARSVARALGVRHFPVQSYLN